MVLQYNFAGCLIVGSDARAKMATKGVTTTDDAASLPMHLSIPDKIGWMISNMERNGTEQAKNFCLLCCHTADGRRPDGSKCSKLFEKTLVLHLQKRHSGCITYLPRHIRDLLKPYVELTCSDIGIPDKRKTSLLKWFNSLPEHDTTRPCCQAGEDFITVSISQFSGVVWFKSADIRPYETIAAVLNQCPQPRQKWPGDRCERYKFVLGTRVLQDGEIIGDLLNEQGADADRVLDLTLCVESLRTVTTRLKNRTVPTPSRAA